jgi:integrase
LAAKPEKVSNGWRVRWYYKSRRQQLTEFEEGDAVLAKRYLDSIGNQIAEDDPLIVARAYLVAGVIPERLLDEVGDRSFAFAADSYMATKNWTPNTTRQFERTLVNHYADWMRFGIARFTNEHLNHKYREFVAAGYQHNTVLHYLEPALQILSYAFDMGWLPVNPVKSRHLAFKRTMLKSETRLALTETELTALLSLAPDLATYDMILTMAQCGLRIGEVCGLAVEDINLAERRMTVRATMVKSKRQLWTKGNRLRPPRIVALNDDYCLVLAGYIHDPVSGESRPGGEPLFPSRIQKRFRQADNWRERVWSKLRDEAVEKKLIRPGIDLVPHVLRHSMASWYAQHIPLRLVGKRLGHASEKTTDGYVHRDLTLEREVMDKVYSAPGRERLLAAAD